MLKEIEDTNCKFCAEPIKLQAIICRYCYRGVSPIHFHKCPACGDMIRKTAKKCRFCGSLVENLANLKN